MTEPAAAPALDKDAPNVPISAAQLQAIAQNVVADPRRVEDLVTANAALTKQLEQAEVRLAAHRKFMGRLRSYLDGGTDCYPSDLEAMIADELSVDA